MALKNQNKGKAVNHLANLQWLVLVAKVWEVIKITRKTAEGLHLILRTKITGQVETKTTATKIQI